MAGMATLTMLTSSTDMNMPVTRTISDTAHGPDCSGAGGAAAVGAAGGDPFGEARLGTWSGGAPFDVTPFDEGPFHGAPGGRGGAGAVLAAPGADSAVSVDTPVIVASTDGSSPMITGPR